MKIPFILPLFLAGFFQAYVANGQLLYEDHFDYLVGNLPGQGGWTESGTVNVDKIAVASGSLAAPSGFAASQGNKASYGGPGSKADVSIGTSVNSGTVYYSFLLNLTAVNSMTTTGIYLGGFENSVAGNAFASGFAARIDEDNPSSYNLGVVARQITVNANSAFSPLELALNTTYLIVVSHTFVAGAINDVTSLWITPTAAAFGADSAPVPNLSFTNTVADASSIGAFYLYQNSSASPNVFLDELRVGTTWASVTPVPEPSTFVLIGVGLVVLVRRGRRA